MSKSKGLVGIVCSGILSLSILVYSLSFGGVAYAAETGGYPWADAQEVNIYSYDWGYSKCQPEMAAAKTCSVHYSYKGGASFHSSDPWRYDVRNCTSFVAWKISSKFNIPLVNWGDAKNWDISAKKAGYAVDNRPRANDIAVWEAGRYGHVAFVTSVNPDGSVNVEQYNKAGKGEYSQQSRVKADHYIHVAPLEITPIVTIPVMPQPVIQTLLDQSTAAKSLIPVSKSAEAVPVIQVPSEVGKGTENNTPNANKSDLTSKPTDNTKYFVGKQPKNNEIKTFAIKYKDTKSGKVELNSRKIETESPTDETFVTPETLQPNVETNYTLADYDADGLLDMYGISYSSTGSNKVEVSVLDGKSNYSTYLGKWTSMEESHTKEDVWYGLADQNGDNSLDLYQIWQYKTKSEHLEVKILSGKDNFTTVLSSYMLAENQHSNLDAYYMLGDCNNDGKIDIYQVLHNETKSGKTEVKIFDGSTDHVDVISKWQTDLPNFTGLGLEL